MTPRLIVLDTNIVLDAFVFSDPAAVALRARLEAGTLRWIATEPMRDELERVLGYRQIVPRLVHYELVPGDVLDAFDRHACLRAEAAKAPVTCKDADDQKFIDLAVAHQSLLLSKDQAVLCMARRLSALRVWTGTTITDIIDHRLAGDPA
jgi:predicted nucleic acid-binding protein